MRRTTPTTDLEAILDLMLLELHAVSTACRAAFRIREQNQKQGEGGGGRGGSSQRPDCVGHLHSLGGTLEKVGLKDIPSVKYIGRQWHKCYYVNQNSMNNGTTIWGSFIICYMDSSLIKGCVGWGYLVWDGAVEHKGSGELGEWSSVFQAEITAITRAAQLCTLHKSTKVVLFCGQPSCPPSPGQYRDTLISCLGMYPIPGGIGKKQYDHPMLGQGLREI